MEKIQINLLKEILSIPTYFGNEYRVSEFLMNYGNSKGYNTYKDKVGNVYFEKGKVNTEYYPCLVAHMDSVFSEHVPLIVDNQRKIIKQNKNILKAYHPITFKQTGLAADDLAGVFICLQLMDKFDTIKASFFVKEEYGCEGSYACDIDFFNNVGYCIQFDAPGNNWFSNTLMGIKIYSDEFFNDVKNILHENHINNISKDPYTDVMALREQLDISCANLPAGYYQFHSDREYLNIDDVDKSINIGVQFINKLGNKLYEI